MPEGQIENEQREQIIEIGEWFNPFVDYKNIPYLLMSEDYQIKTVAYRIRNISLLEIHLIWPNKDWQEFAKQRYDIMEYLLVSSASSKILKQEDVLNEQQKIETKILNLFLEIDDEKWMDQDFPYFFEVKLPDGTVLEMKNAEAGKIPFYRARRVEDGKEFGIVVPENKDILEKIQMRIVPIPSEGS